MKILAIRGRNLASLEGEFDVDFTTEPLKSAGIFAITGSTGAGKSTILDALCLALFDDAPRLREAEAVNINDVEDKTITQKDSRNMLRRGACEGYAEAEFLALNGDKYRSRWMVRRARGKADGALQPTFIKLENLTNSTEEQGTKTDLLHKITEIIGLNFAQFTRAVLLAQGEFANFLKAKQNEKAELLEKLTGTEVYSKISKLIYEKTNIAKDDLSAVERLMQSIQLMSEEETENLQSEKKELEQVIKPLKEQQLQIKKQQDWLTEFEIRHNSVLTAENALAQNQQQIQDAAPRYSYMTMLDVAQDIRDVYLNHQNKVKQCDAARFNIISKKTELTNISNQQEIVNKELAQLKAKLDKVEKDYQALKPDMQKAGELDAQIRSLSNSLAQTQEEFNIQSGQKEKAEIELANMQFKQKNIEERINEFQRFFEAKQTYKTIIPRADFIVTLLDDAKTAIENQQNASDILKSNTALLTTFKQDLTAQESEAEKLNNLLPTEVLEMRSQLQEGFPCPVCGSTHHPLQNIAQDVTIDEEHLKKSKETTLNAISNLKEKIESTQKTITQYETQIENYRKLYNNSIERLEGSFPDIPNWKELITTNELRDRFTLFANRWNEYEQRLITNTQENDALKIKYESELKSFQNITLEHSRKKEQIDKNKHELQQLIDARKTLLNGLTVEQVETKYTTDKASCSKTYEVQKEKQEKLEKQKAEIGGIISQIENDIKSNTIEIEKLQKLIQEWLQSGKHPVTENQLKELMSRTRDWINTEKEYLNTLRNNELVLNTTLKERKDLLAAHQQSPDKPGKEIGKEILTLQHTEIENKLEEINKRFIEISTLIAKQVEGERNAGKLRKERDAKRELFENWAKLNSLLGSATGNKFKAIAQQYTLDVLLSYANKHLEDLSKRYQLEKIPNSLALQVIDNDMLGEVRTIHSLSGGESFLISLSLALGLSSLSSNRMKIESLFIDEGFGSLDIDTLNVAMDALENLQTQGRKIGVISHVEEMKERIPTQIQVIKASNGRSTVKVVG